MSTERPLCVLQMLPELESGGVERGTLEVGRALVAAGHRSLVMSAGGRMVAQLEREGSRHHAWAIGRKSLLTLRLVPRLRRFLREQAVDIIHARSRMPAWLAWLAWRGMDAATRPRFVTTVHGLYSVNAYSAIMARGECVIAVSETVRDYVRRHYAHQADDRVVVIPRGVDPASFPYGFQPAADWLAQWHAQHPQLAGQCVLLLPGRITRLKGHEDFIALIATLRTRGMAVHGLIVGGAHPRKAAYLRALHDLARAHGVSDAVTFAGQRDDLREIMAVSDLVLSLSSQPESFGRTVLEALSLGVRVVGYDHGGVGEILRAVYPVGAVAVGDLDALADKVQATLRAAPPAPAQPYPLQAMLDATLALYRRLAAQTGDRHG